MGQEEPPLRPGDPHVRQPALLLELALVVEGPAVGERAFLEAGDEDDRELEALGRVEGDHRHGVGIARVRILVGDQGRLLEQPVEGVLGRQVVVAGRDRAQLEQVVPAVLALLGPVGEHRPVAGALEDGIEQLGQRQQADSGPERADDRREIGEGRPGPGYDPLDPAFDRGLDRRPERPDRLAAGGSEEGVLHIYDAQAGKDLPETANRAGGDSFWRADSRSFFYPRGQKMEPGMPKTAEDENGRTYLHVLGRAFDDAQRNAFAVIERMVVRLALADRVLISTPMWNFGIPYKLKHYFDLIVQPGLTFSFDPSRGYGPLLKTRPTLVILASGGDFVTGMNRGRTDMATPYLRDVLRFIGLKDSRFVLIGPTIGPPGPVDAARNSADRKLSEIALTF